MWAADHGKCTQCAAKMEGRCSDVMPLYRGVRALLDDIDANEGGSASGIIIVSCQDSEMQEGSFDTNADPAIHQGVWSMAMGHCVQCRTNQQGLCPDAAVINRAVREMQAEVDNNQGGSRAGHIMVICHDTGKQKGVD